MDRKWRLNGSMCLSRFWRSTVHISIQKLGINIFISYRAILYGLSVGPSMIDILLADEEKQSIHTDLFHLNLDPNATPFRCGLCCAQFEQVMFLDKHTRDEEHQVNWQRPGRGHCNQNYVIFL